MGSEAEVIDMPGQAETALTVRPHAAGLELWSPDELRATIAREKLQREIILEYVRGEMKEGQHYYTGFNRARARSAAAGRNRR
jgi:hypothetical protein